MRLCIDILEDIASFEEIAQNCERGGLAARIALHPDELLKMRVDGIRSKSQSFERLILVTDGFGDRAIAESW